MLITHAVNASFTNMTFRSKILAETMHTDRLTVQFDADLGPMPPLANTINIYRANNGKY